MRISDWSSDVCSSDLDAAVLCVVEVVQGRRRGGAVVIGPARLVAAQVQPFHLDQVLLQAEAGHVGDDPRRGALVAHAGLILGGEDPLPGPGAVVVGVVRGRPRIAGQVPVLRSEEHTSELQSLMRISYAVFCLKKKKTKGKNKTRITTTHTK